VKPPKIIMAGRATTAISACKAPQSKSLKRFFILLLLSKHVISGSWNHHNLIGKYKPLQNLGSGFKYRGGALKTQLRLARAGFSTSLGHNFGRLGGARCSRTYLGERYLFAHNQDLNGPGGLGLRALVCLGSLKNEGDFAGAGF
jgi:hypothetical protein